MKRVRRVLRIFFSLLYGSQLEYIHLSGCKSLHRPGKYEVARSDLIVDVCAYAEYWGCLESVGSRLLQILKSAPGYWQEVAVRAKFHLAISVKLKDEETYLDALRNMIATASSHDEWTKLSQTLNSSEAELRAFYGPQMETNQRSAQALITDLQKLDLHETRAHFWGLGW